MTGRTLVACLGNIFLGDDGFGVEVAKRFAGQELPEGVRVTDYGIRGMHLAYDLAEGFDTTILVDAMQRGDEPGTVYVIEPQPAQRPVGGDAPGGGTGGTGGSGGTGGTGGGEAADGSPLAAMSLFDAHGMQPEVVLDMAGTLGAEAGRVLVVGCEPMSMEEGIGLSPPVAAAVDEAVRVVTRLVTGGGPRYDTPQQGTPPPQSTPQQSTPQQSTQRSAAGPQQESRERDKGSRPKTTKR
jgi:hydrogenase maturation protease